MLRLTWKRSVLVRKPSGELFNYTLERLLSPERVPGATKMEVSEGPVGPGTTVHWSTLHDEWVLSDSLVITEFEEGRKISTRLTRVQLPAPGSTSTRWYANLEASTTTLFEPVPGGTRMKASIQLWISGASTLWQPVMLLADGNTYRKQFHKRMDDMLDQVEGPSRGRKVASFIRQHWSGWIVFAAVLLALLWAHASYAQLGIPDAWLQVVRVVIGLMVVGALLGGYFMAIVRQSR
ncbi:MAG: hypothetical protein M3441_11420 [Chloroflexota bacterium]|nr:hypothetical protein [Chloroflexota bacterium]